MTTKSLKLNIFSENIFENTEVNEKKFIQTAKKIFKFYMDCPEIADNCCLTGLNYNAVSFDFLYCGSQKTHEINRANRDLWQERFLPHFFNNYKQAFIARIIAEENPACSSSLRPLIVTPPGVVTLSISTAG